jgi:hypothetical protein
MFTHSFKSPRISEFCPDAHLYEWFPDLYVSLDPLHELLVLQLEMIRIHAYYSLL